MSLNKLNGEAGEKEVVSLIACPNCRKPLMQLPPGFPLYDVQCTGCNFRAQVKTIKSKPKDSILGAGWQIMDKVLKSGFITPPLIVNFSWSEKDVEHKEIHFYPFVSKNNLKKYLLPMHAKRGQYWMFRYIGLKALPKFILYSK